MQSDHAVEIEKLEEAIMAERQVFQHENDKFDKLLREKDEELKILRNKTEKEKAVSAQKLEFLEMQLKEAQTMIDESRRTQESMVKALESREVETTSGKEEVQKKIEEIKIIHTNEIIGLEETVNTLRE